MLTTAQIEELKRAHSPYVITQADHAQVSFLRVSWVRQTNNLSSLAEAKSGAFIIGDSSGYLTATPDPGILMECIKFEAAGGVGTLRELLTGHVTPKADRPDLTLDDLEIE